MPEKIPDVEKRRAARRKKIRRRRIKMFLLFLLITSIVVGVALSLTVLFPIKNVSASGSSLYTPEALVRASGITQKTNFFLASQKRIEERIRSVLPYVDKIVLEKEFPESVTIKATDAKEYACYKVKNKYYTVSQRGYVLDKLDYPPENLFEVICDKAECNISEKVKFTDEYTEDLLNRLIDTLNTYNISINKIDISNQINLVVRVENRFDVSLGADSNIENKIAHLSGMISSIAEGRTGKINLSMWTSSKSEGSFVEGPLE